MLKRTCDLPKYILPYPLILLLMNFTSGIIAPVLIIYYRREGITLLEIGILSSLFELSMGLFEIPTGFIADKFGRKVSIQCCFIFFTVCGIVYMFFRGISGFAIACILQGIGYTFISGALQAWGIDTLKSNNDEKLMQNMLVVGVQFRRVGFLLGSLLGGYLGLKHMNHIWILFIAINFATLLYTTLSIKEIKGNESELENNNFFSKFTLKNILIDDSKTIIKIAIILFVVCILYEFALSPIDEYWTVLFSEELNIKSSVLGWLIVISNALLVLFIKPITKILSKYFSTLTSLITIKLTIILQIIFLARATNSYVAMLAYIGYKFFIGICEPITQTYLNSMINDKYRATVLSVYNMAGSIGEVISGVLIGWTAQKMGLKITFYISSVGIAFIIFMYYYLVRIEISAYLIEADIENEKVFFK